MSREKTMGLLCLLLIFFLCTSAGMCKERKWEYQDFSLMNNGLKRIYRVHIPSNYDSKKALPVVIYLHGGGGNVRAAFFDGIDKYSDKYEFILAAPQAAFGKVKFGHFRGVWNCGKWEGGGGNFGNADDVDFISKMIDELQKKYNVDKKRIYATGISNGGAMTNLIACKLADKIASIATVAPAFIPKNCHPIRPVPVMNIHGTADPCCSFDGSDATLGFCARIPYKIMSAQQNIDKWLSINKCSSKNSIFYHKGKAICVGYNECAYKSEVVLCKIEGMGHTYPSGSQYLPSKIVGPVSHDITFDQIWDFFRKYPLK